MLTAVALVRSVRTLEHAVAHLIRVQTVVGRHASEVAYRRTRLAFASELGVRTRAVRDTSAASSHWGATVGMFSQMF